MGREICAIGKREAEPDDKPTHRAARIAVGGAQPAEERRRPISAADNRLPERKKQRADQRTEEQRATVKNRPSAGGAKDQRRDENKAHEQRAIDRALDEAGAPMFPHHLEARRTPGEPIESNAGQKINDRP